MLSIDFDRNIVLLALAWIAYLGLHSVLASVPVKDWTAKQWPAAARRYRLHYNLIALVLLLPLAAFTLTTKGQSLWRWEGAWSWVSVGGTVLMVVGFAWSSRAYDLPAFLGLRNADGKDQMGLSTLHRFVRHPWYFFGLLWLWTRDMDTARLAAAVPITVYIWIGSWLEDRKLEQELGESYRRYRSLVPGLLPRPWRYLKRAEFEQLSASGRHPARR